MKLVVLLAVVLSSMSAFAADTVQFKENSAFSTDVQKVVKAAIENRCRSYVQKGWSIWETTTSTEALDEAVPTAYYTTLFVVDGMDNDNMHPATYRIAVRSIQYDNSEVKFESIECNH